MSEETAVSNPGPEEAAAEAIDPATPTLALSDVTKMFHQGTAPPLTVLSGLSMAVHPGELVALVGPSGAGKSTLLHIAGLLERPTEGEVLIAGESCGTLSDNRRTAMREKYIGFVYQYHHLLPEFSALENVMIPQMLAGLTRKEAKSRALELLDLVGLTARQDHRPGRLSGGEQQRVAIARALANAPRLLLADEPTGNLDHQNGDRVFDLLRSLVRGVGLAALVATHNLEMAARMDRVLILRDGEVRDA